MRRTPSREHPFVSQFGARVRYLRFERAWTVKMLAEKAGIWDGQIVSIELGLISPTLRTVRALAVALNVEPFDLLNCDHRTDLAEFVEMTRSLSPRSVRNLLVVVRDAVGKATLEQVEAAVQEDGKGQKGGRREPTLRKASGRMGVPSRTSAPPAA